METTDIKKVGRPKTGKKPSLQVSIDPELLQWVQREADQIGVSASTMASIVLHKARKQQETQG